MKLQNFKQRKYDFNKDVNKVNAFNVSCNTYYNKPNKISTAY